MNRGTVYEQDLGSYLIVWNTLAWSTCTADDKHHPTKTYPKGAMPEEDLPLCHCGARQVYRWKASVQQKLGMLGPFQQVKHVEQRSFKLRRQRTAWIDRMATKYGSRTVKA